MYKAKYEAAQLRDLPTVLAADKTSKIFIDYFNLMTDIDPFCRSVVNGHMDGVCDKEKAAKEGQHIAAGITAYPGTHGQVRRAEQISQATKVETRGVSESGCILGSKWL